MSPERRRVRRPNPLPGHAFRLGLAATTPKGKTPFSSAACAGPNLSSEPAAVVTGQRRNPVHAVPLAEQRLGLLGGPLPLRHGRAADLDLTEQLTFRLGRHNHQR